MVGVYKGDKLLKMDQGGERSNSNPRGKLPLFPELTRTEQHFF